MIPKWAKLLPYWILMWAVRNQSNTDGKAKFIIEKERTVKYYQISEGEFIVFSQEIQDVFDERKALKRENKRNKKLDKLNKQLRNDSELKSDLRIQFENEAEDEKLVW